MCRLQEDLALHKDAADSADTTASVASGKPNAHALQINATTQKGDARRETLLLAPLWASDTDVGGSQPVSITCEHVQEQIRCQRKVAPGNPPMTKMAAQVT